MSEDLKEAALAFHRLPKPGKLEIQPTKPLANQRDLALAYSPGVAYACEEIADNPAAAFEYTARGNLVAVISNGTAVLGLGSIGALASKPVMEGKAVLFKKFANIDVFDIELDERDIDAFVDTVVRLEPTFGAINLEDIKAPVCFAIERKLKERLKIPVFHDDQHGTAICVAAATLNGLRVIDKKPQDIKLVCSGAGASAMACLDLLIGLGVQLENIRVCDSKGVIHSGRNDLNVEKTRFAVDTPARDIGEVMAEADVFLGLSGPGTLTADMVKGMARDPIILALANPTPEIMPEDAIAVRPDAIIATGRSDYPNQVNNVLCFPFIFRGALDCGATEINMEMKLACVRAIADITKAESSDIVANAYGDHSLKFGRDYIIPKPFDPRLITTVPVAVAEAAMKSGVAQRPIEDLGAYAQQLSGQVYRSGYVMKSVFEQAKKDPKRVVYANGEEDRVLRAAQQAIDEGVARPILIGRPFRIQEKIDNLSLRLKIGTDVAIVDPASYEKYDHYARSYHDLMGRAGASPKTARMVLRSQNTVIAAMMVRLGDADAMLAGPVSLYRPELLHVLDVIGLRSGVIAAAAMQMLVLDKGVYFLSDTHVTEDPSPEEIYQSAVLAAEQVKRFGLEPKMALLSASNFGSNDFVQSVKMRKALQILHERAPALEVEGEMHGDTALNPDIRNEMFPNSRLNGQANTLILPDLTSANIAYNLVKTLSNGISVGPLLLGLSAPAHVLHGSATVRGVLNMTAVAVVEAQTRSIEHNIARALDAQAG
ncbi:MAG: NADP-dependent malic enzyme [Rhodospirillaceae bacterium]|nr:NADP-dependent malic enzyme [Rhodospirillaceae bacterium]